MNFSKAILSSEPSMANIAAGRCVVAEICGDGNHIAEKKPSLRYKKSSWPEDGVGGSDNKEDDDEEEEEEEDDEVVGGGLKGVICLTDIIFHKGKLYAIHQDAKILVCEISAASICWKILETQPLELKGNERRSWDFKYLAESCGELLLVSRVRHEFWTKKFLVFKLVHESGTWGCSAQIGVEKSGSFQEIMNHPCPVIPILLGIHPFGLH
ncbi:hypothetical protein L1049_004818 [Liquidambar formosana]|uniref:KIB1-4 beta-propeller domain-containing protein n=1 Tax=Liquidambar formosana TaxID=63359 RepID=A0AAP0RPW0_LIQFO